MALSPRLPHQLNVKFTGDHWELLEYAAEKLDLSMGGAVRFYLDLVLDRPVAGEGSPSRRELMHDKRGEIVIGDQVVSLESITRAEAPA